MKTLTIIDENKIMMDNKLFIHLEDEEPTFSVGQWVICDKDNEIYRIEHFDGKWYCGNFKCGSPNGYEGKHLRPATPAEIESHLRKICDEKYIGKKVMGLRFNRPCIIEWQQGTICKEYSGYVFDGDYLNVYDKNNKVWEIVYQEGKFAEIIPDKKKLPKTREEFAIALTDCCDYLVENKYRTVEEFLDQYES